LEKGAQPFTPCPYRRFNHHLKAFMTNEFSLTIARIQDSIKRIPDRLSTPQGEDVRSEFARIFGQVIIGHQYEGGLYLTLPFQASLLTDPVLYVVAGGLLVLDHPTRSGESEFAFGEHAHIIDLNRKCSLYENRYPRIISCPRKREEIRASWMMNELMYSGFFGPFAKVAA
jgi:hypothetical protein